MGGNKNFLSYLELLIAVAIWGSTFVSAKYVLNVLSPALLVSARLVVSSLLFLPILFYLTQKKKQNIEKKDFPTILLLSLLGITFFLLFQFIGISYTTASNVSLLTTLIPAFTLFLSRKILKETVTAWKILAILIGFTGAILVIMNGSLDFSTRINDLIGALFVFFTIILWSLYTVIGKKILRKYSAELVISWVVLLGTVMLIPIALLLSNLNEIVNLKWTHWINILYLGIFGSFFCYFLWYHALKKVNAFTAAIFLFLEPLFTVILASLLLGEVVTAYILVGGIMIISGVFFATR